MNFSPYIYQQFVAWLDVAGAVVPISWLQVDYELNALPQATVGIPMGRNAYTNEPSPAHTDLLSLVEPTRVQIMVQLVATAGVGRDYGIPAEPFAIFEGYTAGLGVEKNQAAATAMFTLTLRHWLSELDYSSIFTKWGHPSNPAQYNAAATLPTGGAGVAIYRGPYDKDGSLKEANLVKDLWGSALKPFFMGLTEVDGLAVLEQGLLSANAANDAAANALQRIYSPLPLEIDLTGSIRGAELVGVGLESYIGRDLSSRAETEEFLSSNTFWSVLVGGMASEYLFALVPRVHDALIVPYTPGLRQPYTVLEPYDVMGTRFGGDLPRPIRAFGITTGMTASTMRAATDQDAQGYLVGGWFQVPKRKEGLVHIEPAPRWAGGMLGDTAEVAETSGAFNKKIATADQPDAVGPPKPDKLKEKTERKAVARTFLAKYAESRLVQVGTMNRQADITGPLRLDLSPGTAVAFRSVTDPALEYDATNTNFYGTILRVSCLINIDAKQAATTYHLGYVRTDAQNASLGYAVDQHPLYARTFYGAPLYTPPGSPAGNSTADGPKDEKDDETTVGDLPNTTPTELPTEVIV